MLYFYNIFCFLQLNQVLSPPKKSPKPVQKDHSFLSSCLHGNIYPIIISFPLWQYLTQFKKPSLMSSNTSLVPWTRVRLALMPGYLYLVHSAGLWDGEEAQVSLLPCPGAWQCSAWTVVCGDEFCQCNASWSWHQPSEPGPCKWSWRGAQCSSLLSSWGGTACPAGLCS